MRRTALIAIVAAALAVAGVVVYYRSEPSASGDRAASQTGPGGRGGMRPPMPVEFADVRRTPLAEHILVVGNLIGEATVEVVPRANGRLQEVLVKLGDPVRRGQVIARVEDREIREQVRQAEASHKVAEASIRQREADLKLAKTNLDRSQSLYDRALLPQQTFDDTLARYEAAQAQLDLARAQYEQAKARLDELKITLSNTVIVSPVDGFVGKRFLDPGAFASTNAPVVSVVDISRVRLVANLVERDMRRVPVGTPAQVEVDAFPGETFTGRVSRVAPVFDPATRTAEIEVEVPNPGFRLKPGMYARVQLTVDTRESALVVPRAALVTVDGKNGVFIGVSSSETRPAARGGSPEMTARFIPVETGIRDGEYVEIAAGIEEGARVITTGAGALKDGDRIVPASDGSGPPEQGRANGQTSTGREQENTR